MTWKDLDTTQRDLLIQLYNDCNATVDDLPYTPEFDTLLEAFNRQSGEGLTHHDFWRCLATARKTGQLRRKARD